MSHSRLECLTLLSSHQDDQFTDAVWRCLRRESDEAYARSPTLASLLADSIINQPNFETALFHRVASRLKNDIIPQSLIARAFRRAADASTEMVEAIRADLVAVVERDPACDRLIEPFLYLKGFHAIQAHRLAHWLWHNNEKDFAIYLQSRSSEVFQTDIHPAARFGRGIFLDHATGFVVGATTVVEDDVSLLQNVTLGTTGSETGDRHPKVRRGAMIGAGAKILGNIEIGENARVGAASVVLETVPHGAVVAGNPARILQFAEPEARPRFVNQILAELSYQAFDYTI